MTDTGELVVERDLMVPARCGMVLATDVYRPARPGPFPVLHERTPYVSAPLGPRGNNLSDPRTGHRRRTNRVATAYFG